MLPSKRRWTPKKKKIPTKTIYCCELYAYCQIYVINGTIKCVHCLDCTWSRTPRSLQFTVRTHVRTPARQLQNTIFQLAARLLCSGSFHYSVRHDDDNNRIPEHRETKGRNATNFYIGHNYNHNELQSQRVRRTTASQNATHRIFYVMEFGWWLFVLCVNLSHMTITPLAANTHTHIRHIFPVRMGPACTHSIAFRLWE